MGRIAVGGTYVVASSKLQDLQSLLKLNLSYIEPLSAGPAEILPHLFLGSRDDAVNLKVLQSLGVTHVLLDYVLCRSVVKACLVFDMQLHASLEIGYHNSLLKLKN